jgi:hypothetical protein
MPRLLSAPSWGRVSLNVLRDRAWHGLLAALYNTDPHPPSCPAAGCQRTTRSERLAKYNQLLRIEEELGEGAVYAGEKWRMIAIE